MDWVFLGFGFVIGIAYGAIIFSYTKKPEKCRDIGKHTFRCSECEYMAPMDHFFPNFCPRCGREVE